MTADGLTHSVEKMRAEGLPDAAVDSFAHYYRRLRDGDRGVLAEAEIEPVEAVPDAGELPEPVADGRRALEQAVIVKLNGGLGTSMGMTRAKSLLEVRDGLTFLDVIVRQVLALRHRTAVDVPLMLMNSFHTRADTLAALERYPDLATGLPLDFVQGKVPKIRADDLEPVTWPADPDLEWAPPGHGDVYTSLVTSGALSALLDGGYRYAFLANSDNLGAELDERILAWFARERLPFLMEVADRTDADRKGGHLARRRGGGLVLREVAQTPDEDADAFGDVSRHRFFNTNNLWVDLHALQRTLDAHGGVLGLPMIVNRKTVDPRDASSTSVYQLETAMGAAIDVFDGAAAIRVPRRRFAPVKTTNDLLVMRSDAYALTDEARIELMPRGRDRAPLVDLDGDHYKLLDDFDARFPAGPPSLVDCDRLVVRGDVVFGRGVEVRGTVTVEHRDGQLRLEDGAVLTGPS